MMQKAMLCALKVEESLTAQIPRQREGLTRGAFQEYKEGGYSPKQVEDLELRRLFLR